jgi:beta-mannosidase
MPVAAALAAAGVWSLDGPARDFDRECWWYRCRFDQPEGLADGGDCTLGLDGLATLASVWLNGEPLLDSRNMFRAHALEVGDRLRAQGNELLIRFDPLADELAKRKPRPRWRSPMLAQQQLRYWRTTMLGRTPGWSPPAVVVGPWRDVWLQAADATRPVSIDLQPRLQGRRAELAVHCRFDAASAIRDLRVVLDHAGRAIELALVDDGHGQWQGTLVVDDVEAWWPHTHGRPARHAARLVGSVGGRAWSHELGAVGFRSVEADTADGGFGLRINNEPVFARGVCWVPLDTLKLHAEPCRYREVLTRLRDAGVNLIRVGGTMAYEADVFFELCDDLGLMVWQELMFANMDYPADDAGFAAEVEAELASQLPMWARRASVVVVCGNSEVEQQAAMWGASREYWQPPLFHERIAQAVAEQLPGVVYWPSSAHGGSFPFQPNVGTTSYYGVGAYRRPLADASASGLRFATECLAFAQVPPDSTLARLRALNGDVSVRTHSPLWKARAPRDLGAGWDFDDVRDHYVKHLFSEDPMALRMSDPARHLVLGRAAASEAVVAAFCQWRAASSACRGAMVWFLRDLWAGAGWGYLDDQCQPKAVFHALARVCQPLHLGLVDDGLNGFMLHAANERDEVLEGTLSVAVYREGEWPVAHGEKAMQLHARSCQRWSLTDWLDGFTDLSWTYRFGPPPADVLVARWQGPQGIVERIHFVDVDGVPMQRRDIGLSAEAGPVIDDAIEVTVRSRGAARFVHFEADGWQADDEGFHLAPAGEKRLRFTPVPGHPRRPWRATVSAINALVPATVRQAG